MLTLNTPAEPFTANDEAFFEAALDEAHEVPSEPPVALGVDEATAEGPASNAALAARRARLVRPVGATLIALSVLAAVGIVRHGRHADATALHTTALVAVTANHASATALTSELVPGVAKSTSKGSSNVEPLGQVPQTPISAPQSATRRADDHAKTKPGARGSS